MALGVAGTVGVTATGAGTKAAASVGEVLCLGVGANTGGRSWRVAGSAGNTEIDAAGHYRRTRRGAVAPLVRPFARRAVTQLDPAQ